MRIYKNSIASKLFIDPIGSTTLTAGPDTLVTLDIEAFGAIKSATMVCSDMTLAGAGNTFTWYGTPNANGSGTATAIAQVTLGASAGGSGDVVLQIDAEDISEAAEQAGLGPAGFKSLLFKVDASNSDTMKSALVIEPLHMRDGLTPSDVTALT